MSANAEALNDSLHSVNSYYNFTPRAPKGRRLTRRQRQRGGAKKEHMVHCLSQLKRFAPCIQTHPLRAYQFFYNLGRLQELVGDTARPELYWTPIEKLIKEGRTEDLPAHIDILRNRLALVFDEATVAKGC